MRQTPNRVATALLFLLTWLISAAVSAANLEQVNGFGINPGNLLMFQYVPRDLEPSRPLVVALHGCTQSAADYDDETGWVMLAERLRFALLLPQQQHANNERLCFNWFEPRHNARGSGEAESVKEMIDKMEADHRVDSERIYVTGLSGGGGMTAVMLAAYPDVFAGGGIIAGIPYRCAGNVTEALTRCGVFGGAMRDLTPRQWGDRVRDASTYPGPFPRVSIWHGSDDATVKPKAMQELMEQWTDVLGIDQKPEISETLMGRIRHEVYEDLDGNAQVETWLVGGMGHGTPIDPGPGEEQCGVRPHAEHIIEAGICSSLRIARFWGLTNRAPTITITSAEASGNTLTVRGTASDEDGFVVKVAVSLDGVHPQAARDGHGTDAWSATFENLPPDARYVPVVSVRDDQGATTTIRAQQPVVIGEVAPNNPPSVRIDAVDVDRSCVLVHGRATDPDPDSPVDRVEVSLGTRPFIAAVLDGAGYRAIECELEPGTYTTRARAFDAFGAASAIAAGTPASVDRHANTTLGSWRDHMNADRIRVYQPPCRTGFGTCDELFVNLVMKYGEKPFPLFRGLRSDAWFLDEAAALRN